MHKFSGILQPNYAYKRYKKLLYCQFKIKTINKDQKLWIVKLAILFLLNIKNNCVLYDNVLRRFLFLILVCLPTLVSIFRKNIMIKTRIYSNFQNKLFQKFKTEFPNLYSNTLDPSFKILWPTLIQNLVMINWSIYC